MQKSNEYHVPFFEKGVAKYKDAPMAMHWWLPEHQTDRFKVIAGLLDNFRDLRHGSLVDIGSGVCDLLLFILNVTMDPVSQAAMPFHYYGMDSSPSMIRMSYTRFNYSLVNASYEAAIRQKFPKADPPRFVLPAGALVPRFKVADFMNESYWQQADYVICSGCITIGDPTSWKVVHRAALRKMMAMANKAVIFNMLDETAVRQFAQLPQGFTFYNRTEVFDFVQRELDPHAVLVNDYDRDVDFTILMRHRRTSPSP